MTCRSDTGCISKVNFLWPYVIEMLTQESIEKVKLLLLYSTRYADKGFISNVNCLCTYLTSLKDGGCISTVNLLWPYMTDHSGLEIFKHRFAVVIHDWSSRSKLLYKDRMAAAICDMSC